jgi:ERO1-like protein beta
MQDNTCMEKRVFHRLLSGLHASISTHICNQYLNRTSGEWVINVIFIEFRKLDLMDASFLLYIWM